MLVPWKVCGRGGRLFVNIVVIEVDLGLLQLYRVFKARNRSSSVNISALPWTRDFRHSRASMVPICHDGRPSEVIFPSASGDPWYDNGGNSDLWPGLLIRQEIKAQTSMKRASKMLLLHLIKVHQHAEPWFFSLFFFLTIDP